MGFDMNSECSNCGEIAWEIDETHEWTTVQCRTCGHAPQEAQTPNEAGLRFSTRCSRIHYYEASSSSTWSRPSTPDSLSTLEASIDERDFASQHANRAGEPSSSHHNHPAAAGPSSSSSAPASASAAGPSSSADAQTQHAARPRRRTLSHPPSRDKRRSRGGRTIESIRQSIAEDKQPQQSKQPKWFEQTSSLKFRFVLTPRRLAGAATIAPAALDGSSPDSSASPSSSSSGGGSSAAAGAAAQPGVSRLALADVADDPAELQKLLISAMFLMKNVPEKDGPPKMMDLALLPSRVTGSDHLAMKHQNKGEAEVKNANGSQGARKPIMWKIVVEKRKN